MESTDQLERRAKSNSASPRCPTTSYGSIGNKPKEKGVRNNPRFNIRDQNNGIIMSSRCGELLMSLQPGRGRVRN